MLFWLMFIISIPLVGAALVMFFAIDNKAEAVLSAFIVLLISAFFVTPVLISYSRHASDLATLSEQHRIISVYQQRKQSLEDTLNRFEYPKNIALLNGDSPIASIVNQLAEVEKDIALAKSEKAEAYKSIKARTLGPMSGVIYLF